MTTSHWLGQSSSPSSNVKADITIVGGGYIGLSTAYWLSEFCPDLKIIILDRSHIGAGASGRNAGFLTMGSATFYKGLSKDWGVEKALSLLKFGQESISLVDQCILKNSSEISAELSSSLTLFQSEKAKHDWEDSSFAPSEFNFEWKGRDELPAGLRDRFFGAFKNGPEYKINPIQLLKSLRKKLETRHVQIIENISAYELTAQGIKTEYNHIKCGQVILALNAYFPQFHLAFKDLIFPRRAQMMAVELEDDIDSNALHYDSPERVYWRKSQDRQLLIGGKRLLDESAESGDFEKISCKIQGGLESYLQNVLKVRYKVLHRWSGTMGFTEHELPLISKVEAAIDTFIIGGFSGHGMGFGFGAAKDLAELVTGKKTTSFFDHYRKVDIKL